jgi:predicted NAD/FAD-dependent oxidoreductase
MSATHRGTIAIVGGGIAGLTCARQLVQAGHTVVVIDKARGPGGRASTRRSDHGWFDHGAQYFTARDPRFARDVDDWQSAGVVRPWDGRVVELDGGGGITRERRPDRPRLVGHPAMSSLCEHLAAGVEYIPRVRVAAVRRAGDAWFLIADNGRDVGPWSQVVLAMPAPQIVRVPGLPRTLADRLAAVAMDPCWALMCAFDSPLGVDFDAARVGGGTIDWLARDTSKPGRATGAGATPDRWVVHATASWSRAELERHPDQVRDAMLAAFAAAIDQPPMAPAHATVHRWRYARPREPLGEACVYDVESGIGACGDWCIGPRLEAAYLSGVAMAERILATTTHRTGAATVDDVTEGSRR